MMVELGLFIITIVILAFGFVVVVGAPYLPTLRKQSDAVFELLDLKEGETLLELGCGDGRIVKAAARRGLVCIGYELNPILVVIARIHTWKYRKKVKIIWGDYWKKDWPQADGIFVFLLDKYMKKLDKKIVQKYEHIKLVSFAFKIPGKKIAKTKDGLFLYKY